MTPGGPSRRDRCGSERPAPAPLARSPGLAPSPTPYGGGASGAEAAHDAELLEEPEVVEAAPALADPAVPEPEDVDAPELHPLARRRHTHHLPLVGAARGEVLR